MRKRQRDFIFFRIRFVLEPFLSEEPTL
jgi:hypothetical protein